jgi:superfamily II DNA or RNA helicase
MVLIDKPLDNVLRRILKNLVEEHPLFRLKFLGYEGYVHQAELFYKLTLRYPIRALIADEIGLGKTIETLLLIEWGLRKGVFPNKRVLILVPRSILGQWEKEAERMGLQPIVDIEHFENYISEASNDRRVFIFKIDTAKKSEYCGKLLKYSWDAIVVDEVHKLGLDTQRLELVEKLVMNNPHASIIFLSATPHKGDDEHYIRLLTLLDPIESRVIHRVKENFYHMVIDTLVFRRSKEQVNKIYEEEKVFVDAELIPEPIEPTPAEVEYIESLDELTRKLLKKCQDPRLRRSVGLLAMTIDKRGLSSPFAGLKTFMKILNSVKQVSIPSKPSRKAFESLDEYGDEEYISEEGLDIDTVLDSALGEVVRERDVRNIIVEFSNSFNNLIKLASEAQKIDSKLSCLKKILLSHLDKGEKVIVFTEFADTANYIYDKLRNELTCDIRKITGTDLKSGSKSYIEDVKKWLAESSPRVLVSTDVASEGLNLQYANVVVNFELPWSLIKLEQRAGRVWRLGQQMDVKIYLMILNHSFEEKIFNALYRKLASSIRAYIIPSTLIALKGREIELPASGVFEFEEITPYKLWERYKTGGYEGVDRLIEEYLEKLKRLSSRFKKAELYEPGYFIASVVKASKARLERIIGLTNRNELNQLLCEIIHKFGKVRCDDFTLNTTLKEIVKYPITSEPLCIYCDGVESPVVLLRVCANVMSGDICWIHTYHSGRNLQIKDFIRITEKLSNCEEIGKELTDEVLKHYADLFETVKIDVISYFKQNILQEILNNYLEYIEKTGGRGSRKGEPVLKPVNIGEVRLNMYPIAVIVPRTTLTKIMEEVRKDIIAEIRELITVGDVTEEKLEVEAEGREVLEKILNNKYELTYIGDTKAPFDYIAKDRATGELIFIELKTLKKRKFVIYTENEKEFADRVADKHSYWLYVVDLTDRQVRGYSNPFTTYKLKLITKEPLNERMYYVYEEIGKADEIRPI